MARGFLLGLGCVVLVLGGLLTAPARADVVDRARAAVAAGDGPGAVRLLTPFAQAGDVRAQFALASLLADGLGGVPKDHDSAVHWYRTALILEAERRQVGATRGFEATGPRDAASTQARAEQARLARERAGRERAALERAALERAAQVPRAAASRSARVAAAIPRAPAVPSASIGGPWRAHLATYRGVAEARRSWRILSRTHGDVLEGVTPYLQEASSPGLFVLMTQPFEVRSEAADLCERLKARGGFCVVRQ